MGSSACGRVGAPGSLLCALNPLPFLRHLFPPWDEPRERPLCFILWSATTQCGQRAPSTGQSPGSKQQEAFGTRAQLQAMGERELRVALFPPPGDCQRGNGLSTLPNAALPCPRSPVRFSVMCLSTVMSWYKVNNLCGKDPVSPQAVCTVGACLVYLLRRVWSLRAYGV